MKRRLSLVPFGIAAALGCLLYRLQRARGGLTDLLFALGSGMLIVGLCLLLSNLKAFASMRWGTRMLKRLFRGEARTVREETEDYARYRASLGGHGEAVPMLALAFVLLALSAVTAVYG